MNKIAVMGAGWYGCHIASSLRSLGFGVKLFEKESDVMLHASGNNQFRLHLGFHYARNHNTRIQSRDGYQRFIERYPTLSSPTEHGNIYSVPTLDSLIDFKTYKLIMISSGIEFNEIDNPAWSANVKGSILCEERVIETQKARDYFKNRLNGDLYLNTPVEVIDDKGDYVVVNGEKFDFVVDCTWGKYKKTRNDVFYEPTILTYYRTSENFPAFTLVDGQLASIYPTEHKGIYSVSSVTHTPLNIFNCPEQAKNYLNTVDSDIIKQHKENIESHITKYVPEFREMFKYEGPQLSLKTKIIGSTDDRSCYVDINGRYISVNSGKIDTVFHGMNRVLHYIESFGDTV